MPRKRARSPAPAAPAHDKSELDDDDFLFDDTQSLSGRSGGSHEPQHRNAANARERARMRVLSKAFCRLKTTLPWVPADTKLSKLDTLRLAASYIAHLRALLHEEPRTAAQMFPHPLNLAWPFAFQHGATGQCAASPRSGWSSTHSHSPSPPTRDNRPKDADIPRDNVDMSTDSVGISREGAMSRNCHGYVEFASNSGYGAGEMAGNETNCAQSVQFCSNGFSYRENYYEMRNAYSDSLINNIQ